MNLMNTVNKNAGVDVQFHFIRQQPQRAHQIVWSATRHVLPHDSVKRHMLAAARQAPNEALLFPGTVVADNDLLVPGLLRLGITPEEYSEANDSVFVNQALDPDGAIRLLSVLQAAVTDRPYTDLVELTESGYLPGDPLNVIVEFLDGLGGFSSGGFNFADWLINLGVDKATGTVLGIAITAAKDKASDREIRQLVSDWEERGFDRPQTVRIWFDKKSVWTLLETCKRLRLTINGGIFLLRALGYDRTDGDRWELSPSEDSIARRRRWFELEQEFRFR